LSVIVAIEPAVSERSVSKLTGNRRPTRCEGTVQAAFPGPRPA
jgi:hypothetical protein